MTGVTSHGLRYPDGDSKAKNLGPELQQFAEDVDRFIDEEIDANSQVFRDEAAQAAETAVEAKLEEVADTFGDFVGIATARPVAPSKARAAFMFEDGTTPLQINEDGTLTTREFETRDDVYLPGVAAAFVFEDGSIAATIGVDGTFSGAGQATAGAVWPAEADGDSTTYGDDLADTVASRWTTDLNARIGNRGILNRGLNGARAEEIAVLAGALTMRATLAGAVAGAGVVNVTIAAGDVDPWRAGSQAAVSPVDVVAIADNGTVMTGTLARAGAVRTFTRTDGGAAVPASAVSFRVRTGTESRLLFLGAGVNNEALINAGTQTLDQLKAWYRSITSRRTGPLVVWGMLDRGTVEAPGTATGDLIAALEKWLAAEYGDAFAPVRQYLSSARALADAALVQAGFAPTSADNAAIAAGTTPPSFRAQNGGSVHLNELGHKLQARFFHRHLILRGLA